VLAGVWAAALHGVEERPEALGSGSWQAARTSADGRSVLVVFIGGAPDGVCAVRYEARAHETPSEVRVEITGWSSPAPPATAAPASATAGHSSFTLTNRWAPVR
jgi:hypothetical protein